jgi:cobalt-zinc-cadmium efflux system outer membrane protein
MKTTATVPVFIGLLAWAGAAHAGPSVATNLTIRAAVALAVSENAELKSRHAKWEGMLERPLQAGTLPNPMFTYSYGDAFGDGGSNMPSAVEQRFMVQQDFPWFGKRRLRAELARKDAEIMRRELETTTLDVVMMVKESYFSLYAVQQAIAITREEDGIIRRMEKVAETMYATGERAQVDVLKAQAEITMLKQKLLELQSQENTLQAKLNTLLNRRADAPLRLAAAVPETGSNSTAEVLFALASANRPEIRAAQAQVERSELERRLMAKEFLPDYRLGFEYRNIEAGNDMFMVTVGVDLPIWRSKYRAGVRESEKMRVSSQAAREAAERQSAFDVQDAAFKLQTARRTLELYRKELFPQAVARFNASEAGYQTGKVDFMDFLESQRFLLSIRIMAAMAEGDVGMQFARLERAVGADVTSPLNAGEMGP